VTGFAGLEILSAYWCFEGADESDCYGAEGITLSCECDGKTATY
jgi:hypothetical protein